MPAWILSDWTLWVLTALVGVVGFALALRGILGDRAGGRPRCWKCRYDLTGVENLTCPKCGRVHKNRAMLFNTRRYYKRFALGMILFLLALHCHTGPQVQYRRATLNEQWWQAVIPTAAWIAMVPYLGEEQLALLDHRLFGMGQDDIIAYAASGTGRNGSMIVGYEQWTIREPLPIAELWDWQRALLVWRCRAALAEPIPPDDALVVDNPDVEAAVRAQSARREHAAYWLGGVAESANDAATAGLIDLLRELRPLRHERIVAANVMRRIANPSDDVKNALIGVIGGDADAKTREIAINALEIFPNPDPALVSLLSCMTSDAGDEVRFAAAQRLARIKPATNDTIAAVRSALLRRVGGGLFSGPEYLSDLGDAALPFLVDDFATLAVQDGFQGHDKDLWDTINGALIDSSERATPHLIPLLRNREANVRYRAMHLIGIIGDKAVAALPALRDLQRGTTDARESEIIEETIKDVTTQRLPE